MEVQGLVVVQDLAVVSKIEVEEVHLLGVHKIEEGDHHSVVEEIPHLVGDLVEDLITTTDLDNKYYKNHIILRSVGVNPLHFSLNIIYINIL